MEHFRIAYAGQGWDEVFIGSDKIGGFGETTRDHPDMRWYWTANGSCGHCATRDEAIEEIRLTIPAYREMKAKEEAARKALEALPVQLQDLHSEMDRAHFEQQRAWGRTPFNDADYRSASDRWFAARLAFDKAHDAWLGRREAA